MKNEIKLGGCGRAESFPGAAANLLILFLVFTVVGIAMVPIIVVAQPILPKTIEPAGNTTNQSTTEVVIDENQTAVASPATKR